MTATPRGFRPESDRPVSPVFAVRRVYVMLARGGWHSRHRESAQGGGASKVGGASTQGVRVSSEEWGRRAKAGPGCGAGLVATWITTGGNARFGRASHLSINRVHISMVQSHVMLTMHMHEPSPAGHDIRILYTCVSSHTDAQSSSIACVHIGAGGGSSARLIVDGQVDVEKVFVRRRGHVKAVWPDGLHHLHLFACACVCPPRHAICGNACRALSASSLRILNPHYPVFSVQPHRRLSTILSHPSLSLSHKAYRHISERRIMDCESHDSPCICCRGLVVCILVAMFMLSGHGCRGEL